MQELQYIPRDLAGKVIGRGGKIVQEILEKSKLNNIKVIGDQEAKERKLSTKDVSQMRKDGAYLLYMLYLLVLPCVQSLSPPTTTTILILLLLSFQVPFELVGRRKAIENAKMMLEYHLDHLRVSSRK